MRFGVKGTVNVPDALAALATVRALIRVLEEKGVLEANDVDIIRDEALRELPTGSNEGQAEARRLVKDQVP